MWVDLRPQEGNLRRQVHGLFDLVTHPELVARLPLQNERCVVKRAVPHHLLELQLVRDRVAPLIQKALRVVVRGSLGEEGRRALGVLRVERLEMGAFVQPRYRVFGRILAVKVRAGHVSRVELPVIVARSVKELSVGRIDEAIVLGALHRVVPVPGELAVDVSLLVNFGVLGHASALHLVCLVRVELTLRGYQRLVPIAEIFIKILLVVLGIPLVPSSPGSILCN